MLNATKTNTDLNDAYQDLGQLTYISISKNHLQWENPRVRELIRIIDKCHEELLLVEDEVKKIKRANSSRTDRSQR